jgi:hypothetical protein
VRAVLQVLLASRALLDRVLLPTQILAGAVAVPEVPAVPAVPAVLMVIPAIRVVMAVRAF